MVYACAQDGISDAFVFQDATWQSHMWPPQPTQLQVKWTLSANCAEANRSSGGSLAVACHQGRSLIALQSSTQYPHKQPKLASYKNQPSTKWLLKKSQKPSKNQFSNLQAPPKIISNLQVIPKIIQPFCPHLQTITKWPPKPNKVNQN